MSTIEVKTKIALFHKTEDGSDLLYSLELVVGNKFSQKEKQKIADKYSANKVSIVENIIYRNKFGKYSNSGVRISTYIRDINGKLFLDYKGTRIN